MDAVEEMQMIDSLFAEGNSNTGLDGLVTLVWYVFVAFIVTLTFAALVSTFVVVFRVVRNKKEKKRRETASKRVVGGATTGQEPLKIDWGEANMAQAPQEAPKRPIL